VVIEYKNGRDPDDNDELRDQMANYMNPLVNFQQKRTIYFAPKIRLHAVGNPEKHDVLLRGLGILPIGKVYMVGNGVRGGGMTRPEFIAALSTLNQP